MVKPALTYLLSGTLPEISGDPTPLERTVFGHEHTQRFVLLGGPAAANAGGRGAEMDRSSNPLRLVSGVVNVFLTNATRSDLQLWVRWHIGTGGNGEFVTKTRAV